MSKGFRASPNHDALPRYAFVLWLLTFLFFLRVLGQFLVAFFDVSFLPPMEQWYSGLIPYPILLFTQILILIFQVKVCTDFSRRRGFFVISRKRMGHFLRWFSYLYFASMALRYVATMALFPERRRFGGTIPIVFHFVLAGFLFAFGHFHSREDVRSERLK
jgi:hypothetical protein